MVADLCGAYALSEAGSGSDAFALQTRAELNVIDYVLTGARCGLRMAKRRRFYSVCDGRSRGGI